MNENLVALHPYICRYIDATELFDCIKNKRIILRDPKFWEDKNDYFLIKQYIEGKGINNIYASCFTSNDDAYHFWKIYANRPTGICIKFDTSKLFESIKKDPQMQCFRFDVVQYRALKDVTQNEVNINEYPFIKRLAFKAEEELRLFFEESKTDLPYRTLGVELDSIKEVVISPLIRDEFAEGFLRIIKSAGDLSNIRVRRSTILESSTWQKQMQY